MKDCLILGNTNAVTYKDVFPLIKEGKLRSGYHFNTTTEFITSEGMKTGPNISWYTTLATPGKSKLVLTKTYNEKDYPKFDNYDAINVNRLTDIPYDYDGVMGVPITILKYDLENVEIKGIANDNRMDEDWVVKGTPTYVNDKHKQFQGMVVNGKPKYARVLMKIVGGGVP